MTQISKRSLQQYSQAFLVTLGYIIDADNARFKRYMLIRCTQAAIVTARLQRRTLSSRRMQSSHRYSVSDKVCKTWMSFVAMTQIRPDKIKFNVGPRATPGAVPIVGGD
jgi:hypothetical protein